MSTPPRRFPPPWRVEEEDRGEVLKVLDAKGQILAYVLYEDEPIRRELMKPAHQGRGAGVSPSISPSCRTYWGHVHEQVPSRNGREAHALSPQPGGVSKAPPQHSYPVEMPWPLSSAARVSSRPRPPSSAVNE
jgi:hypothetical protein